MAEPSPTFNDEFLAAIGRIAVLYEYVEYFARFLIGYMISNDDKLNEIVTVPLSTKQLPEYLLALFEYRHKDPARVNEFRGLVADFRKLADERHTNVHAVWAADPIRQIAERYRPSVNTKSKNPKNRGLKNAPTEHEIAYLDDVSDRLSTVSSRLEHQIALYIRDHPDQFQKKRPPDIPPLDTP